jgi:hypothetical protein
MNLEAALAFMRGTQAEKACTYCAEGKGPFKFCITFDQLFRGACSNCRYNGNGSGCTFHELNAKDALPSSSFAVPSRRQLLGAKEMGEDTTGMKTNRQLKDEIEEAAKMTPEERLKERKRIEHRLRVLTAGEELALERGDGLPVIGRSPRFLSGETSVLLMPLDRRTC